MRLLLASLIVAAPLTAEAAVYSVKTTYYKPTGVEEHIADAYVNDRFLQMGVGEMGSKTKRGMGQATAAPKLVRDNDLGEALYDDAGRKITMCSHQDRTSYVMDEAFGKRMEAKMNQAGRGEGMAGTPNRAGMNRMMEEALANAPPEQRAAMRRQMEQMMGGAAKQPAPTAKIPGRVKREYRATGRSVTKNGFATRVYDVLEDGRVAGRFYGANPANLPGGALFAKHAKGMAALMKSIMGAFGDAGSMNAFGDLPDGLAFIGEETLDAKGAVTRASWITAASNAAPPSTAFKGCPSYALKDMLAGM